MGLAIPCYYRPRERESKAKVILYMSVVTLNVGWTPVFATMIPYFHSEKQLCGG